MEDGNNRPIKIGKYLYLLRLILKEDAQTMADCYSLDERNYVEVEKGKRNLDLDEIMPIARFLTSLLEADKRANKFNSEITDYINRVIDNLIYYYIDVSNSVVNYLSENIDYHFNVGGDSFEIKSIVSECNKNKKLVKS